MKQINAYADFYELVNNRYSCRKYSDEPVSRDKILDIINAARLAPSACNKQPWQFVVVDTPELHDEVAKCYDRNWMKFAPVYIIACGNHAEAWHRADGKDHTDIDVAIAVEHICLAASALGFETCWVCNFDEKMLSAALNMPEDMEPIAIIPLGYRMPDSAVAPKNRKEMDQIVKWGKY